MKIEKKIEKQKKMEEAEDRNEIRNEIRNEFQSLVDELSAPNSLKELSESGINSIVSFLHMFKDKPLNGAPRGVIAKIISSLNSSRFTESVLPVTETWFIRLSLRGYAFKLNLSAPVEQEVYLLLSEHIHVHNIGLGQEKSDSSLRASPKVTIGTQLKGCPLEVISIATAIKRMSFRQIVEFCGTYHEQIMVTDWLAMSLFDRVRTKFEFEELSREFTKTYGSCSLPKSLPHFGDSRPAKRRRIR